MRYPASGKLEIIGIVEQSHLPARKTLDKLEIALALNVNAAPALQQRGITMIGIDPGWMRTDMGGINAPDDPAVSARGIIL